MIPLNNHGGGGGDGRNGEPRDRQDSRVSFRTRAHQLMQSHRQSVARAERNRFAAIDRFFLVLFPLMFLVFNLTYWIAYYTGQGKLSFDWIYDLVPEKFTSGSKQ